ncbi:MAG: peptidylprolyl isomerase [Solirubrobacterales bacterium]
MTPRGSIASFAAALVVAGSVLGIAACGEDEAEQPASGTTVSEGGPDAPACEEVAPAEPKKVKLEKPSEPVKPKERIVATVETNCGDFQIDLDTKGSPKTTGSFVHMVDEGLYGDTPFHRVVDGFVIQGGDPAADGTGGPGYSVTEEPGPNVAYTHGVVAMAKSGVEPAGTSGSQFFVVTGADAGLPPDYAVLGELTGDEAAVDAIEAQAGSGDGPPVAPVVIERITLER